ncbi:MAG: hypothetical protein EAS52_13735 [Parapedobacter sp.]|nr:MAG: hypothetical protein EAS52_13735 [Parapedobacter sp.]
MVMNIKPFVLLFFLGSVLSAPLFAQQQNTVSVLQPEEVIAFHFTDVQVNFWLSAENYISERMKSGIDIYSDDFYRDATSQEKMWLNSIDAGDSPYNTDYRSRYWGSNWSYASGLIAEKSDTLAYDFNLLTAWHSPTSSNGLGKKITLVFESSGDSEIKTVLFFPGNMRTPVDWQKYGRPAKVALRINGNDIAILHLKDVMACQVFKIPMTASYQENEEITVVFDILSVYPGSEFEETVISEINFDGMDIL